jgi:hypothetical protein
MTNKIITDLITQIHEENKERKNRLRRIQSAISEEQRRISLSEPFGSDTLSTYRAVGDFKPEFSSQYDIYGGQQ